MQWDLDVTKYQKFTRWMGYLNRALLLQKDPQILKVNY